jgi:hypothetical protein
LKSKIKFWKLIENNILKKRKQLINMCDGRRFVSISIRADVYDKLYHLSKIIVPGTVISIPKVIEVITNKRLTKSKIILTNNINKKEVN